MTQVSVSWLRSECMTTPAALLDVCVAAAHAGGAVLVAGLSGPRRVQMKSARASIVTEIDLASQAAIFDVIGAAYPDHVIMGEEGDGGGDDRSHTWLVDPLDGTSNYASGIPFACVSVAVRDVAGSSPVRSSSRSDRSCSPRPVAEGPGSPASGSTSATNPTSGGS